MPLLRRPFVPSPAEAMLLALGVAGQEALPEWLERSA